MCWAPLPHAEGDDSGETGGKAGRRVDRHVTIDDAGLSSAATQIRFTGDLVQIEVGHEKGDDWNR